MSHSSSARPARRVHATWPTWLAWLALVGMLMGPLAPRRAAPTEGEGVDAELIDAAEIENSTDASAQRLVQRGARVRVGPPGARRPVRPPDASSRPVLARTGWLRRVSLPRRVVPTDDDPDEYLV